MRTVAVATTETQVAVACDQPKREWIVIQNVSDTTIYLSFDGSATALTTSNGFRLASNETLTLSNEGLRISKANNGIKAIHGGTGSKELRIQECAADGYALEPAPGA